MRTGKSGKTVPLVWLLVGDKLGDNAQVMLVADALGWPYEIKQLYFRVPYVTGKPFFKPSLYHLDRIRSARLTPPWPEFIITAGSRPSMAALWIRKQSGGRVKIVLIGRPKRRLKQFALVLGAPQYRLPEQPNIMRLGLPLIRLPAAAAIATAGTAWQERLSALPSPLTAVLVGGQTSPFVFDAAVARQLLEQVNKVTRSAGGTLYITTSRRTPAAVADALETALPAGSLFYRWRADAAENPYLALLGRADRFVVTGDSISMMMEVVQLGRPVAIFPLPNEPKLWMGSRRYLAKLLHPPTGEGGASGLLRPLGNLLYRLNLTGYSRDLTAVHRLLIKKDLAVWLGEPFRLPSRKVLDELPRVVERIQALRDNRHAD
jgi:mitochondrial fission protein ELM1